MGYFGSKVFTLINLMLKCNSQPKKGIIIFSKIKNGDKVLINVFVPIQKKTGLFSDANGKILSVAHQVESVTNDSFVVNGGKYLKSNGVGHGITYGRAKEYIEAGDESKEYYEQIKKNSVISMIKKALSSKVELSKHSIERLNEINTALIKVFDLISSSGRVNKVTGDQVKRLRLEFFKCSQREMADKIGTSSTTYQKMEAKKCYQITAKGKDILDAFLEKDKRWAVYRDEERDDQLRPNKIKEHYFFYEKNEAAAFFRSLVNGNKECKVFLDTSEVKKLHSKYQSNFSKDFTKKDDFQNNIDIDLDLIFLRENMKRSLGLTTPKEMLDFALRECISTIEKLATEFEADKKQGVLTKEGANRARFLVSSLCKDHPLRIKFKCLL